MNIFKIVGSAIEKILFSNIIPLWGSFISGYIAEVFCEWTFVQKAVA